MFGRVLGLLYCCWSSVRLLLKVLVACSTLVWSSVRLVLKYLIVLDRSLAISRQFDLLVKYLVACSTLVWPLVANSTSSISFGLVFEPLCLAVGRHGSSFF